MPWILDYTSCHKVFLLPKYDEYLLQCSKTMTNVKPDKELGG
ncbi:protein of unknown function [Magnetospirillum sp. XM-1]|nr:protein of unknown function [Magnetospirillum sp. XM-1]